MPSCDFAEILSRHGLEVPDNCESVVMEVPVEGIACLYFIVNVRGLKLHSDVEFKTGKEIKQFAEALIEFVDNH